MTITYSDFDALTKEIENLTSKHQPKTTYTPEKTSKQQLAIKAAVQGFLNDLNRISDWTNNDINEVRLPEAAKFTKILLAVDEILLAMSKGNHLNGQTIHKGLIGKNSHSRSLAKHCQQQAFYKDLQEISNNLNQTIDQTVTAGNTSCAEKITHFTELLYIENIIHTFFSLFDNAYNKVITGDAKVSQKEDTTKRYLAHCKALLDNLKQEPHESIRTSATIAASLYDFVKHFSHEFSKRSTTFISQVDPERYNTLTHCFQQMIKHYKTNALDPASLPKKDQKRIISEQMQETYNQILSVPSRLAALNAPLDAFNAFMQDTKTFIDNNQTLEKIFSRYYNKLSYLSQAITALAGSYKHFNHTKNHQEIGGSVYAFQDALGETYAALISLLATERGALLKHADKKKDKGQDKLIRKQYIPKLDAYLSTLETIIKKDKLLPRYLTPYLNRFKRAKAPSYTMPTTPGNARVKAACEHQNKLFNKDLYVVRLSDEEEQHLTLDEIKQLKVNDSQDAIVFDISQNNGNELEGFQAPYLPSDGYNEPESYSLTQLKNLDTSVYNQLNVSHGNNERSFLPDFLKNVPVGTPDSTKYMVLIPSDIVQKSINADIESSGQQSDTDVDPLNGQLVLTDATQNNDTNQLLNTSTSPQNQDNLSDNGLPTEDKQETTVLNTTAESVEPPASEMTAAEILKLVLAEHPDTEVSIAPNSYTPLKDCITALEQADPKENFWVLNPPVDNTQSLSSTSQMISDVGSQSDKQDTDPQEEINQENSNDAINTSTSSNQKSLDDAAKLIGQFSKTTKPASIFPVCFYKKLDNGEMALDSESDDNGNPIYPDMTVEKIQTAIKNGRIVSVFMNNTWTDQDAFLASLTTENTKEQITELN
jgi:hypothetical protein